MASTLSSTSSRNYIEALEEMSSRVCDHIVIPPVYRRYWPEWRGLYVVWVRGWDGVGRSAILHHATPTIMKEAERSARSWEVLQKLRGSDQMLLEAGRSARINRGIPLLPDAADWRTVVTYVHISTENRDRATSHIHREVQNMMGIQFLPDDNLPKESLSHFRYVVMVDNRMHDDVINLERLCYKIPADCSIRFVVTSVMRKNIGEFSCHDVAGKFEDLEATAALGLLRDEAHGTVADLLNELGTSSSGNRDPFPIHLNGDLVLECLLYTTLFSSSRNPMDYWSSEGFLGDGFQHSGEMDNLMNILLRILEDRMLITRPMRMEIRAPLISKARVLFCSQEARRGRLVLLKHSMHLKDFPADDDLKQQQQQGAGSTTYRISLSNNDIEMLPPSLCLPQCCPNLCTLLLDDNPGLCEIPDEVFSPNMPNLRVLDLSGTAIRELPSSLECCTNLRMLSLNRCLHLQTLLPTIEGDGLHRLEVLNLEGSPLTNMTKLSLQHMHNLKHLNFVGGPSNLEEFHLSLNSARKIFINGECSFSLKRAHFLISIHEDDHGQRWRGINNIKERPQYHCYANILHTQVHPRLHHPIFSNTSTGSRTIGDDIRSLEIHGTALSKHPHTLLLHYAKVCKPNIIDLCDSREDTIINFDELCFSDTKSIRVERCHLVQDALQIRPENCDDYKPRIENIHLSYLRGLRTMCFSRANSTTTILPRLKKIHIECCPNLCSLFDNKYPVRLPMLKVLVIKFCPRLQSFYSISYERSENIACGEKHLPALETMVLCELPQLSHICSGHLPSIRRLKVRGCPRLVKVEGP